MAKIEIEVEGKEEALADLREIEKALDRLSEKLERFDSLNGPLVVRNFYVNCDCCPVNPVEFEKKVLSIVQKDVEAVLS